MWSVIFLLSVGLNICQAAGEGSSTQMYYVKLTIEKTAVENITEILKTIRTGNVQVDDFEKTTECAKVGDKTECTCNEGFVWTDKVCKSSVKCCGNDKCSFTEGKAHMCVSNITVTLTGRLTIEDTTKYKGCLADTGSTNYADCNSKMSTEIKKLYSTLEGFDILTITQYSFGSIIVDFEVTVVSNIDPKELTNKSQELTKSLQAKLSLETRGVVDLTMPDNPVPYNEERTLTCKPRKALSVEPEWQLKKNNQLFDITDGVESKLASGKTTLTLSPITEVWAGEYTCAYYEKSTFYTISHIARAVMDVSLLPVINITVEPQFPHCKNINSTVSVKGKCEIAKSTEDYKVTWTGQTGLIQFKPENTSESTIYAAQALVSCSGSTGLTCTFKNRCNQTRNDTLNIIIIKAGDRFCAAEGDWPDTKSGYTAKLKCTNTVGQRTRECKDQAWQKENSACVNRDLNSVLQSASMIDIGLGFKEKNAAEVFVRLQNATNNTKNINSPANVKTSVDVLDILSKKLNESITNNTAVENFLESSSNLLEESLKDSWSPNHIQNPNSSSFAETYLRSVEWLIHMANVTEKKKKSNLEVKSCNYTQGNKCNNDVFNVTVSFGGSDDVNVKTAGFKHLEDYLPHDEKKENSTINSIIVSTTIDKKSDSVEVSIDFVLLEKRPRNVELHCVSWDYNTSKWSTNGCEWVKNHSNPLGGRCLCKHLSSFAILMSKYPVEIPGLSQVTTVALSVSVISLIISLAIELTVWSAVVKTTTLYLRHTAHINISVCLLVADICFLASSNPGSLPEIWCKTFVLLKHFCYLGMFFWMLCLSTTLLHQAVFLFHNVSKKVYLRLSLIIGYACPFLIVFITFLANNGGAEGTYFYKETCWLVYTKLFEGSIHTFIIPIGIIVFFNVFSMLVVIMKLLDHPKNAEKNNGKEITAAKTVMRSVVFLTPIFGVTWSFGFGVALLDLTEGFLAYAVNYAFTLLNAFQGLFILLTTCLGDKLTREALLNRFKRKPQVSISDSSTKLESTWKK